MVRAAMPQARLQRLDSREGVQSGRHAECGFGLSGVELRDGAAPAVCRRVSAVQSRHPDDAHDLHLEGGTGRC